MSRRRRRTIGEELMSLNKSFNHEVPTDKTSIKMYDENLDIIEDVKLYKVLTTENISGDISLTTNMKSAPNFTCDMKYLKKVKFISSIYGKQDNTTDTIEAIVANVYIVRIESISKTVGQSGETNECLFTCLKNICIKDLYNMGEMNISDILKRIKREYVIDNTNENI